MKNYKALLFLMAALLVAIPAYNTAWAAQNVPQSQDSRGVGHRGNMMMNEMTQEQMATYDKIMMDHQSRTQTLQNDIWAKQTELNYLGSNEKTDPKTVSKMIGELKELRVKLQNEWKATSAKLSKDLGINTGYAHGMMRGNCDGSGDCGMGSRGNGSGHRGGGNHGSGQGGYHNGGRW